MSDFEQGFQEELAKIGATLTPKMKPMSLKGGVVDSGIDGTKATAMRSPLSMVTAMKPPKQTQFFDG